jgi:UDP-glucose 4-epimerase
MNYLVTGGCGFIGSHLVDALWSAGHSVRILDNLSTGSLEYKPEGVGFCRGDVADLGDVADAMGEIDGCFHLAAVASVEKGNTDWLGTHRTNLTGTITVFEASRRQPKPIPVVYASSAAVYGNQPGNRRMSEDDKPAPISAYGADKLGCELHGAVACLVHRVPNYGLRFFNVYGPRQDPTSPYSGVITIFANKLKAGQPITINGDGHYSRDYIYVSDVVTALQAAMKSCEIFGGGDIFNVCTGIGTSVLDLARELQAKYPENNKMIFGPARPGDPRFSVGTGLKAHKLLKFDAKVSLEMGLKRTITA